MDLVLYGWPFAALAAGLVGVVALVAWPRPPGAPPRWHDPEWLVCLMLPVYMLHQFEEHGFDLLGRRYHFIQDLCTRLGHPHLATCPATPAFILAVNVGGGVWIQGLLAMLFRRRNVMVGACALGVALVNAAAHLLPGILGASYNSGLLTAAVLFVPLCVWVLRELGRAGVLHGARWVAVVASGVVTHALLISSLLAYGRGLISHQVLLAINVAYGVTPLLIGYAFPARRLKTELVA